jgi:hypothetical protein
MMNRCYNENRNDYKNYGGRGITVCEEWHDPSNFIAWAISNNWQKHLRLDREKNDLGYMPSNCRFVTIQVNNNNSRNNHIVTISGETMSFADAHRKYGVVKYQTAMRRFHQLGWNISDSLQKPRKRIPKT